MAEKRKFSSPFLRYEGPVLLPPIRIRKPQPRAPWFDLGGKGGRPLSLQDKMRACETLEQLEDLWAGAQDAQAWGAMTVTPEDVQCHLEMQKKLAPVRLGRAKRSR